MENAFSVYYKDGYKIRFLQFTNDYSKQNITHIVNIYTSQKCSGIITWPLFCEHKYTKLESKAARDFFVDYIISCRKNEDEKTWKKFAKLR